MSFVAAVAASHAPNILLEPGVEWEQFMDLHYRMAPHAAGGKPPLETQQKLRRDAEAAFEVLRANLERARPDVLIVVANDQFVNFFFDNIPTFFVSVGTEVKGQFTRHRFQYKNHADLGRRILTAGVAHGLDLSFGEKVELQHTQTVPLYFLLREPRMPILPIYVNTWIEPLPAPHRCYELGKVIRQVADEASERVALLATGGLSHFPGSPRIGEIDTRFDEDLLRKMKKGRASELAPLTLDQLVESGNTEFLNWMVALGAVGDIKASDTFYMPDHVATGWGFASWRIS